MPGLDEETAQKNAEEASAFRKKVYRSVDELQVDLDQWMETYNNERPHSGRYCYGKTPMQTFHDSKSIVNEKRLDKNLQLVAN